MSSNFTHKVIFTIISCFIAFKSESQSLKWTSFISNNSVLSSPRASDLNGDGVKDIVIGGGLDGFSRDNAINAINGATGEKLWSAPATNEVFGSAVFVKVNDDETPDVVICGRHNQLYALNGKDGSLLWKYITPSTDTIMNFYNPAVIPYNNNELLVANGGQHQKPPTDQNRETGRLKILSAITGDVVAQAKVPDGKETYCAPILVDFDYDNNFTIIYGTGGENATGSLWAAELSDLRNNTLANSKKLATGNGKGFIAPPSVADLTHDGSPDIIAQCFDGSIHAIDYKNNKPLWKVDIGNTESTAEVTIGNFIGDITPDVFAVVNSGTYPNYTKFNHVIIDGATGKYKVLHISDLSYASATAADINGDGRDEVLVSVSNIVNGLYNHSIKVIDFQNNYKVTDLIAPSKGSNLSSTPWIGDLDDDKKLDVIFANRADSSIALTDAAKGIFIRRVVLNAPVPDAIGIAWGQYMGTDLNGAYTNNRRTCDGVKLITGYDDIKSDCNSSPKAGININVSGGTSPYTFVWSNGAVTEDIMNIIPDEYSVTVTDAKGCTDEQVITLEKPYYIHFNVTNNTCPDGNSGVLSLYDATSCMCSYSTCLTNFYYQGKPIGSIRNTGGLSKLKSGWYVYEFTSTYGCKIKDSVEVGPEPFKIEFVTTMQTAPGQYDATATATVTGGSSPYTYKWNDPNAQTSATCTGLKDGNSYSLTVKDSKNCPATADVRITDTPTGIGKRYDYMTGLSVYPNPSKENIVVEIDRNLISRYDLKIYDLNGMVVREYSQVNADKLNIERQDLEPGLYHAVLMHPNGGSSFRVMFIE